MQLKVQKKTMFFETVQSVFNFFGGSGPRWALLALGEDNAITIRQKVLKKYVLLVGKPSIIWYFLSKLDLLMYLKL